MRVEIFRVAEREIGLIKGAEAIISRPHAEGLHRGSEGGHLIQPENFPRGGPTDQILDVLESSHSRKFVNSSSEKRIEKMKGEDVFETGSYNLLKKNGVERKRSAEEQKKNVCTENETN